MVHYVTDLINAITQRIEQEYKNRQTATHNAWTLLTKLTERSKADLIVSETVSLTQEQENTLEQWLTDITQEHKPLQYIIGSVPFLDAEIFVEPPIVIPRPETEMWCHTLIETLRRHDATRIRILDMCTGAGCIAVALAQAFPHAEIWAADVSSHALELTHKNAQHNTVSLTYMQSDVFRYFTRDTKFDVIVSNPPYVSREEWHDITPRITQWEDPHALVAADDGYAIIQELITHAPSHLRTIAYDIPQLWIEIGYLQGNTAKQLYENAGFTNVSIIQDIAGFDRVVTGYYPQKL